MSPRRLLANATALCSCLGFLLLLSSQAGAVSRTEVLVRAKAYAFHPWTCSGANLTASCDGGYQSVYTPGDYLGLPYDWGGYMSLFTFDQQIAAGYGAGSYPEDGILDCTSGVDCSGFVSRTWKAGHTTTSGVYTISTQIGLGDMAPGDIFNEAGYHMAMYSHTLQSGEPVLYEAIFYNVHLSMPGWSWVNGYIPRRYDNITGTTASDPLGTPTNPIQVGSFPYSDQRNTSQSMSDVLDGCGASPGTQETGPEFIYAVNITQPGVLTAMVQDDAGVDIDVHLYTSMNTNDCFARHDSSISEALDCGTYYVVADTFKGAQEYPGAYTLTLDFAPSGGSCGSGPPSYDFEGGPGDPCGQPFCNPNLGATVCVQSPNEDYCSNACSGDGDCAEMNGCCYDFGSQEYYCVKQADCGGGSSSSSSGGTGGGGLGIGGGGAGTSSSGEGGAGTSSSGEGAAGAGTSSGQGAGNNSNSSDDDSDESGGCHLSGAPRGDAGWLSLAGLLLALGVRRRRAERVERG